MFEALGRFRARVRRWLRPPRILRPTRAGWLFLLIILGVGFAALNTGNNLLYLVLSLMLAFLALSGVMSETALRGIQVRRRLPAELFAGRANSVRLEITNTQRRVSSFAVAVEDRLRADPNGRRLLLEPDSDREDPDERRRGRRRRRRRRRRDAEEPAGRCFALRVGAGETLSRRYTLTPRGRGPVHFTGFRVSTRFPFGLFLKYREIELPEDGLVYPQLLDLRTLPELREAPATGQARLVKRDQGGVVAGLREFTDGDSIRRVHWRSSLRRGALMVSETEDDRDAEVEVRLHSARGPAERRSPDRFEAAVTRAASEAVAHLQGGLAVALRTDASYLPADAGARQRTRLLSFLARVAPDGRVAEEPAS